MLLQVKTSAFACFFCCFNTYPRPGLTSIPTNGVGYRHLLLVRKEEQLTYDNGQHGFFSTCGLMNDLIRADARCFFDPTTNLHHIPISLSVSLLPEKLQAFFFFPEFPHEHKFFNDIA